MTTADGAGNPILTVPPADDFGLISLFFGVNGRGGLLYVVNGPSMPGWLGLLVVLTLGAPALGALCITRAPERSGKADAARLAWRFQRRDSFPARSERVQPEAPRPGLFEREPGPPSPSAVEADPLPAASAPQAPGHEVDVRDAVAAPARPAARAPKRPALVVARLPFTGLREGSGWRAKKGGAILP